MTTKLSDAFDTAMGNNGESSSTQKRKGNTILNKAKEMPKKRTGFKRDTTAQAKAMRKRALPGKGKKKRGPSKLSDAERDTFLKKKEAFVQAIMDANLMTNKSRVTGPIIRDTLLSFDCPKESCKLTMVHWVFKCPSKENPPSRAIFDAMKRALEKFSVDRHSLLISRINPKPVQVSSATPPTPSFIGNAGTKQTVIGNLVRMDEATRQKKKIPHSVVTYLATRCHYSYVTYEINFDDTVERQLQLLTSDAIYAKINHFDARVLESIDTQHITEAVHDYLSKFKESE